MVKKSGQKLLKNNVLTPHSSQQHINQTTIIIYFLVNITHLFPEFFPIGKCLHGAKIIKRFFS